MISLKRKRRIMGTNNGPRRVVVTGLGALSPIGNSAEDTWQAIIQGKSGAGSITRFDATSLPVQIACEIRDLNLDNHFSRKEINRFDRITLYALLVAREAWRESRLDSYTDLDAPRAGVIWASGNGGIESLEEAYVGSLKHGNRYSPYLIPRTLIDTPSGMLALQYGLQGINYCPVSACASSSTAFMDAFNYIRWNKADIILAGGSDAPITHINIGGFGAMKALSTRNSEPSSASRPMDSNRDGFVMGEGAGMLILEELEHAQKRGAPILGEIVGAGMSNDAYHATSSHPEGKGAILAINMALEEAGIHAHQLDYVNLHATSTPAGDLSELNALSSLIDEAERKTVYVSSTKGSTGHLLGAAGAIEAVITVKSILNQLIPPTINTGTPDEKLPGGFNYVWNKPVPTTDLTYALSNNFGFGGHNAVVLFKRYSE